MPGSLTFSEGCPQSGFSKPRVPSGSSRFVGGGKRIPEAEAEAEQKKRCCKHIPPEFLENWRGSRGSMRPRILYNFGIPRCRIVSCCCHPPLHIAPCHRGCSGQPDPTKSEDCNSQCHNVTFAHQSLLSLCFFELLSQGSDVVCYLLAG